MDHLIFNIFSIEKYKLKEFEIFYLMKVFQIIIIFLNVLNVNSFKNIFNQIKPNVILSNTNLKTNIINKNKFFYKNNIQYDDNNRNNKNTLDIKEKSYEFLKLIRSHNIIPTFLLCFSGGWIIKPSFYSLIHSVPFLISCVDTILIMSASMVLNDIYDLEIDKINSPDRPLASGKIKLSEAFIFALLLLGTSEYLTLNYLSDNLKLIIQLVIINITTYTPILKRILIIKNISCAGLVSFSVFFSGLAVSNTIMSNNNNFGLLSVTMSILFFGSWCNELLLDMSDIEGDKNNNINTFPVLFGNKNAWVFTNIILYYGIISNTLSINYLYDNQIIAGLIPIILSPLLINLHKIKKNNYSKESIVNYMKYSNYPLVLLLFYLCLLAKFH
jgi:geranylgeranylglycerol-phosphate geranylgeranyltransferase